MVGMRLLLHLIGSKVDKKTRVEWEKLDGIEMPALEQYIKFLRNKCYVLEAIPNETQNRESSSKTANSSRVTSSKTRQVLLGTQPKLKCQLCGENHRVQYCERFQDMKHNQRVEFVKKKGLLFQLF